MAEFTEELHRSLVQRPSGSAIAIAADLANDNPNSICRFAMAWISDGSIHGVSYLAKPPAGEFKNRKVTEEMVKDSPTFAELWEETIRPLLEGQILAAFQSQELFLAIKMSYEATWPGFSMKDTYVRDLKYLATSYITSLGNDSFSSIMHVMDIPVDLDSATSRAMGVINGLAWLSSRYPSTEYGIPLSAILAGALQPRNAEEETRRRTAFKPHEILGPQSALVRYSTYFLIPFIVLTIIIMTVYIHKTEERQKSQVNFSKYSTTEMPSLGTTPVKESHVQIGATYVMVRGTYLIFNKEDIPDILKYSADENLFRIRQLIKARRLLVFDEPTTVKVTGPINEKGFVPIVVQTGKYSDTAGYVMVKLMKK